MRLFQRLALLCALTFFSAYAYAVAEGFYMGFATGPARGDSSNQTLQLYRCRDPNACAPCAGTCPIENPFIVDQTLPAKPNNNQWGSRFFMGYMFNPYAGVDFGFNFFNGIGYKYQSSDIPAGYKTCGSASVRVRDIDISGKFALPIQWFDVYLKAGIAYTYQTVSGGLTPPQEKVVNCNTCTGTTCPTPACANTINTYTACGDSQYRARFAPIFSIGASYDITQSWVTDLSYTRLLVGGPAKSIEFIALGISYHFVDVYCGQFLCDD